MCCAHFGLEICFAPQSRTLFQHHNFQGSENGVFGTVWLGSVLRATTACISSSLICPDGSAPAALASHWKNIVLRHFCTFFAHLHLLSSDILFSDLRSYSLLFSASSHLCFSICPIVAILTFTLPSVILPLCDDVMMIWFWVTMWFCDSLHVWFACTWYYVCMIPCSYDSMRVGIYVFMTMRLLYFIWIEVNCYF